jgi:phenylalanyl-tRNA synthetase beta chain
MQERLRRSGIRSIAPIVDITNYVMLERGQPMHAFDLARLEGGIRVRYAQQGEQLQLLDGRTLEMDGETLIIADERRALALAGIMGGMDSAVSETTQDVFLESAFFSPQFIAGKARGFGLHTDSSHRFERGVDPDLQIQAIERATALLLDIVGGEPGPVTEIYEREHLPRKSVIELRNARIQRLLGISPSPTQVYTMLLALGCQVQEVQGGWRVTPPGFRFDLSIEADLIEEIARIYGYDRIPRTAQGYKAIIQRTDEATIDIARIRELLIDRGYQEAITFSFVDPDWEKRFNPDGKAKQLANPISNEMAVMRTTLWPGLVRAAQYNLNRQQTRVRLFETGLRFSDMQEGLSQVPSLACLVSGENLPLQWGIAPRAADFFDLKSDVEALLGLANMSNIEFRNQVHPALHPGKSAALYQGGRQCGWMGALHPELERQFELNQRVQLFEIELAILSRRNIAHYQALSRFPAVRRDIAIVVDQDITAAQISTCINSLGIEALQECKIFDVYTGKGVSSNRKSIALGLILQDLSRTLTDLEIDDLVSRIVSRLGHELGASLRE